jgi:hypothetical protein
MINTFQRPPENGRECFAQFYPTHEMKKSFRRFFAPRCTKGQYGIAPRGYFQTLAFSAILPPFFDQGNIANNYECCFMRIKRGDRNMNASGVRLRLCYDYFT